MDTPGFGDAVDNTDCWSECLSYVERQYGGEGDVKENETDNVRPLLDIKPGVVVKILFPEGVDSVPDVKKKIRAAIDDEKVAYVDAKVGYDVVHVRCEDETQARKLANASIVYNKNV